MGKAGKANTLVVVGEASLARRAAELVPSFQVVGPEQDLELADPSTSMSRIDAMLEGGRTPAAVLCNGGPGFSLLAQIRHFPASRCYVFAGESPWPLPTLQCLVEAAGMTLLQNLESLPVALGGRTVQGVRRPGYGEIPTGSGLQVEQSVSRLKAAQERGADRSDGAARTAAPDDFGWADAPTVQVPPAPVSLGNELDLEPPPPRVVDASQRPRLEPGTAYLPSDLLRVLRPRAESE